MVNLAFNNITNFSLTELFKVEEFAPFSGFDIWALDMSYNFIKETISSLSTCNVNHGMYLMCWNMLCQIFLTGFTQRKQQNSFYLFQMCVILNVYASFCETFAAPFLMWRLVLVVIPTELLQEQKGNTCFLIALSFFFFLLSVKVGQLTLNLKINLL